MSVIAPAVNGVYPPLRILCIHGFCQSASTFKGRTAALRSKLKKLAAFDYAEAPHQLQAGDSVFADESSTPGPKYTWWRTSPPVPAGQYVGLRASIQSIRDLCTAAPQPYSGLLGFSQGASFASLLLQLRQVWLAAQRAARPMIDEGPAAWRDSELMRDLCSLDYAFLSTIRFALLFSAFIPRDPILRTALYLPEPRRHRIGAGTALRTLHVMGEQDRVIAIEASKELVGCFEGAEGAEGTKGAAGGGGCVVEVVVHGGGHHVPSDKAMRTRYVEFIQQQVATAASGSVQKAQGAADVDDEKSTKTGKALDDEHGHDRSSTA